MRRKLLIRVSITLILFVQIPLGGYLGSPPPKVIPFKTVTYSEFSFFSFGPDPFVIVSRNPFVVVTTKQEEKENDVGVYSSQTTCCHPFPPHEITFIERLEEESRIHIAVSRILGDCDAFSDPAHIVKTELFSGPFSVVLHYFGMELIHNWITKKVTIEVNPQSDQKELNAYSKGVTHVAILSSYIFNAGTVDPRSIHLESAGMKLAGGGEKFLCHGKDVNKDGLPDLLCKLESNDLIIEEDRQSVVLWAHTVYGSSLRGEQLIFPPENSSLPQ